MMLSRKSGRIRYDPAFRERDPGSRREISDRGLSGGKRLCIVRALLMPLALLGAQTGLPGLPSVPTDQPFSFIVFGDNRGDDTGEQPPAFFELLQAASQDHPAFVLDTGDMIYGHSRDEEVIREEWRIYRAAADRLPAPIFHAPGNHDIWDQKSARIYRELWGPTYYSFVYGNSRFIAMDTETARAAISATQFEWVQNELRQSTQSNVFLFFHHPLFPVDGGIGSSLDKYPLERNQLHQLFARYRHLIRGVFAGHEHLYAFQEHDGVPYYTSGGGGAPLYTAPELGGFHHFLTVRVNGNKANVELRKISAPSGPLLTPRTVGPGEVLETWNQGLFWYAWDRSANVELTSALASEGSRSLRLNFDLAQYAWPVLVLAPAAPWNLDDYEALSIDVYVPGQLVAPFSLTTAVHGRTKNEAPPVKLNPGWNTVVTPLNGRWLLAGEKRRVETIEWSLSGPDRQSRSYVAFDNLRMTRRKPNQALATELLESWERPLLWRAFDETVALETSAERGLVVHVDLAKCNRPVVFARLNPPWDLRGVKSLELEFEEPQQLPQGLTIALSLRVQDVGFEGPVQPLPRGRARIKFALDPSWLPQSARAAVELLGFRIGSTSAFGRADLGFERLTAADAL